MVFGAQKGFDLWSYLMFPEEFASCGDLGENPAFCTWEEATAQKLVAWTRPWRACVENAGSEVPEPPLLMVHALGYFSLLFDYCPDEIALQWTLALLTLVVLEMAAAWLCVPSPCCLRLLSGRQCWPALLEALRGSLSPILCSLSLSDWHSGPSCLVPVMAMATSPLTPARQWLPNLRHLLPHLP